MQKSLLIVILIFTLSACESLNRNDGIPRIRTRADAAAYNATVSSPSEQLICNREAVLGSNLRQFVCMTVAQHERLQAQAQEDAAFLSRTLDGGGGTAE
jgi:hypothetical protein